MTWMFSPKTNIETNTIAAIVAMTMSSFLLCKKPVLLSLGNEDRQGFIKKQNRFIFFPFIKRCIEVTLKRV